MGQYSEGGRVVVWNVADYDTAIVSAPFISAELASLIATGGLAGTVTVGDIIDGFVIGAQVGLAADWTFEAQIWDETVAAGVDANGWASVYASNGTAITPVGIAVDGTAQYYAIGRSHEAVFPFLVMPRMRFIIYGDIDPGTALVSSSVVISRPMFL